jgi:hypothetical protein
VALQGTLDTFALPDVLRLLASTAKTGCLRVSSSRGEGQVWFEAGAVVAAESLTPLPTTAPVEVLCELLRSRDGEFVFDAAGACETPGAPADVEPLLTEAEQLVAEWHDIEQVVPSLDAWVTLVDELPKAKVSVDASAWRVILAVAAGSSVRDAGTWMGAGELAVCRAVRDLVKLGLATITEAPVDEPVAAVEVVVAEADAEWEHSAPWTEETQWVDDPGYLSYTPEKAPPPVYEPFDPGALFGPVAEPAADPVPEQEPAAEAIAGPQSLAEALPEIPDDPTEAFDAGVAFFGPDEEPEVADEPVPAPAVDDSAPIDRSRLLKFLGSVGK